MALDPRLILLQRPLESVADMQDKRTQRTIQEQEVELRRQEIMARRDALIQQAQLRNQKGAAAEFDPKKEQEAQDYRIKQAVTVGNLLEGATDPDTYEQAKQSIAQIVGPDYAQHLPQTFDPAANARLVAQGKALVAKAAREQEGKTREVTYTNPDGTQTIQIVEDKPGQTFTSSAKPMSATNPTEASLAVAAAKGDKDASKALSIMRGQRVGAGGGAGAPPSAPGAVTLPDVAPGEKNDAYLKSLDTPTQAMVKALAEGRKAFPSGAALRADYWQKMLAAVAKYDPSFDEVNYPARAATRKDFTSGKSAQQIQALNTVIGHLQQLSDAADALHNRGSQTYNWLANAAQTEFGATAKPNFDTIAPKVAQELTRVWRGTGGSEADIARDIAALSSSNAPAQLHEPIAHLGGLLESKLDALKETYRQGMGTADVEMISPDAAKTLAVLEKRAGKTGAAAPVAAGGRIYYDSNGNPIKGK